MRILLQTTALAALMAAPLFLTPTSSHAADHPPTIAALSPDYHAPPPAGEDLKTPVQAPNNTSGESPFGTRPEGDVSPSPVHDAFNDPPPHNANASPPVPLSSTGNTAKVKNVGENKQIALPPLHHAESDDAEGNSPPPPPAQEREPTGAPSPQDDRPH